MNKKLLCLLCFALVLPGCRMLARMTVKGGTEYKVQIEANDGNQEAIVDRTIKVMQSKLNATGSYGGDVARDTNDPKVIIVKVYGTEDPERMKKFLFTAYQLELKKAISPPNPQPIQTYTTAEAAQLVASADQEVIEFTERGEGQTHSYVIVEKNAIVNGEDIRDASAIQSPGSRNSYSITFSLKPQGAVKFGEWTGKNTNNYLAVILDKKAQSVAYIRGQIFDSGEISGMFTKASAEDIALSLKSGYLPATMTVLEEKQFGN